MRMSTKLSAHQKQLLRWLALLPGAILGGVIVLFPIHWILVSWIFPHDGEYFLDMIWFPKKLDVAGIENTLAPFFIIVFSTLAGAIIAPKFRITVACVLSGMWLIAGTYLFWSSGGQDTFEIKTAGAVLGLFIGPIVVWLSTKRLRSTVTS